MSRWLSRDLLHMHLGKIDAEIAAIIIITMAPGQKSSPMGAGPMK